MKQACCPDCGKLSSTNAKARNAGSTVVLLLPWAVYAVAVIEVMVSPARVGLVGAVITFVVGAVFWFVYRKSVPLGFDVNAPGLSQRRQTPGWRESNQVPLLGRSIGVRPLIVATCGLFAYYLALGIAWGVAFNPTELIVPLTLAIAVAVLAIRSTGRFLYNTA